MPAVLVWTVALALHFVAFMMLAIPMGAKQSAAIIAASAAVEIIVWQGKNLISLFQKTWVALMARDDDAQIVAEVVHESLGMPPATEEEHNAVPTLRDGSGGGFPTSMFSNCNVSPGIGMPGETSQWPVMSKPQGADDFADRSVQLYSDSDYIVRIEEQWPVGYETCIHDSVPIAGVTYDDRQEHLAAFIDGTDRKLELEHDIENKHDRYAVKVYGVWRRQGGMLSRKELGWLPSETARELFRKFGDAPFLAKVTTMFRPRPGYSAGIRIEIGCPSTDCRQRMASAFRSWVQHQEFSDWWETAFTAEERGRICLQARNLTFEPMSRSAIGAMTLLSRLAVDLMKPESMDIARRLFLQAEKLGIQSKRVSDLHYFYESLIDAYFGIKGTSPDASYAAIAACEKQIAISDKAARALRRHRQGAGLPRHRGYDQLASIKEEGGDYAAAIRLSEEALQQGWSGKWRKRIERCKRSLANATPQGN